MQQSTWASNSQVLRRDLEIPEEIPSRQALNHTTCWGVSPQSASPVHLMPLLVFEDDPQRRAIDQECLDHGHEMYVPVDSRAPVEAIVRLGAQEP